MKRAAAFFVAAMLAGCNPSVQNSATPSPSPSPTSSGLSLKISGHGTQKAPVRFVQQVSHGNRVQYDLRARSFESIGAQGSARVSFSHVTITFHGKDGSTLIAQAPQANLNQTTNTIDMLGGVHAHNATGSTLACDTLRYDHTTEMIYGTGHVVITGPNGFAATANRFQSDISLTHTRMQ